MKRIFQVGLVLVLIAGAIPRSLTAASILEALDLTGFQPSPVPGQVIAKVVDLKWDTRCIPVVFKVNDTLDPVPNPLGAPFLSVADATSVLHDAAQAWTDIPTSFIDLRVEGSSHNTGPTTFDQVNEITFRTDPGFLVVGARGIFARTREPIAFVRRTVLLADATLNDGDDFDGDGDPDVSAAITTCQDVDGDGDIEFPAGFYKAGTQFDVDIMLATGVDTAGSGPAGFRFTARPEDIDTNPRSADLYAVALQAFALAQGVGHSMIDQTSPSVGTDSVLFPFIDTADPESQLQIRHLDMESIATSSLLYPEGSATSGPAALQDGDVAFAQEFGIISGEIRRGSDGQALAGASVSAIDHVSGQTVATGISGTSRWTAPPNGIGLTFIDPAFHILNGRYQIAVPPGTYEVGVEAVDEMPAGHREFNLETIEAFALGLDQYNEDFYSGPGDDALERRPGHHAVVQVRAGETVQGIDIDINDTHDVANFGSEDAPGFLDATPGTYYAVRFPADQVLAAEDAVGDAILQGGAFLTTVADSSATAVYDEALLTAGEVQPDGSAVLDLAHPLARKTHFVGQDFDFTPFYFENPVGLTKKIDNELAHGKIQDLFLVLRVPASGNFPGPSSSPPLIGLDGGVAANDVPIFGLSYVSADGGLFLPTDQFNFMFKLLVSKDSPGL